MEPSILSVEENGAAMHDARPTFYIGHHDRKRTEVVPQLLQQAQDCGVSLAVKHVDSPVP